MKHLLLPTALILLSILSAGAQFTETETLIPTNHSWEWLHYSPGGTFVDPDTANPSFDTTWFSNGYSETPAFNAASPAPLGYGTINAVALATEIGTPADGNRDATAYFRTTFSPTANVDGLRFEGIIDDGCIFYVNGQEVGRINMTAEANTWGLQAAANGNENSLSSLDLTAGVFLPANVPATLHVSVHNQGSASSDLGFSLRVASIGTTGPATNDDFVDAIELSGAPLPIIVGGRNDAVTGGGPATLQVAEPIHAGDLGGASVWYRWTPDTSAVIDLTVQDATFQPVLAVYTGNALGSLTPVGSSADGAATLSLFAGTTYHIAIDGAGGASGFFELRIVDAGVPFEVNEVLVPLGGEWRYLMILDPFSDQQIDPETADPDFDTTWHTESEYDGPTFAGPAPAMLGYGTINYGPLATELPLPTPDRGSVYFRTTVTPSVNVTALGFQGLIDDGAVIYVNGQEVARINMFGEADDYGIQGRFSDEGALDTAETEEPLFLPANVPVEIAVSVHQIAPDSSDLGFALGVYALVPPKATQAPNDDFNDAEIIAPETILLPVTIAGRTDNLLGDIGAGKEPGEPNHAGNLGGASIWYRWTPDTDGVYSVSTADSSFDTLLAVYTGNAVSALTEIASNNGADFYEDDHLTFTASAGTTYHIAIDGFDAGPGAAFGDTSLTLEVFAGFPAPVGSLLLSPDAPWEYLLYTNAAVIPDDPSNANPAFNTTWYTDAYSGVPAFSGPAPGLLGYGIIDAGFFATDIWRQRDGMFTPPSGERYAAYFRTEFTPDHPIASLAFEGLIDDGAIFYVNGTEVLRINMLSGPDRYDLFATGVGSESSPQFAVVENLNLPANVPVLLAASVHNSSLTSTDMGFHLAVYELLTGESPAFEATLSRLPGGGIAMSWTSEPSGLYDVEFSIDLVNWAAIFQNVGGSAGTSTSVPHNSNTARGWYRVVRLN